jgi:tetratricopeptide (TPR) repeat protein
MMLAHAMRSQYQYRPEPLPPDHKDHALSELYRARSYLDSGDYFDADASLANACRVMDTIAGDEGRERRAVTWKESSKTFRGRPHEKAMASFYRGICQYQMEDYEGALAAFRHSLACDQETISKKQEDLEDFSISHFMAARAYHHLRESSNAEAALAAARRYAGNTPHLSAAALRANCVIIIETASGPYIRQSGINDAVAKVDYAKSPDERVRVLVDGRLAGEAAMITDLVAQAKSQGWSEMDQVRLNKKIGQKLISVVPVVGPVSMLINPEADVRSWVNLPRFLHVFTCGVPPGRHTISIEVLSDENEPLPRYGQTWHHINFRPDQETLLLLRSVRNAQNQWGRVPIAISEYPAERQEMMRRQRELHQMGHHYQYIMMSTGGPITYGR